MTEVLSSVNGIICLLEEPDPSLQSYAVEHLSTLADRHWAEIADSVSKIESLYEDPSFPSREAAALAASKVYFNLGEYKESVFFALGAGPLFDLTQKSSFVETILAKIFDEYCRLRVANVDSNKGLDVDSRLEAVVERAFAQCFADGAFQEALGMALESRRLDKVQECVQKSLASGASAQEITSSLLYYCLAQLSKIEKAASFKEAVLRLVAEGLRTLPSPDHFGMVQCWILLKDAESIAGTLNGLIASAAPSAAAPAEEKGGEKSEKEAVMETTVEGMKDKGGESSQQQAPVSPSELTALQIAFDLVDNAPQGLLTQISTLLPHAAAAGEEDPKTLVGKVRSILSGKVTIATTLEFLKRNNHADLAILKNIKTAIEQRGLALHCATFMANGLMHAGTTVDQFIRDNVDWLGRATNFTKFTETASVGVIHKGRTAESRTLLAQYLPASVGGTGVPGAPPSPYSEGGALYALGLIHANHGADVIAPLLQVLATEQNEVILHGACLGIGLAALATHSDEVFEALHNVLYSDNAVAGEAAGIAMGLVMAGSANGQAIERMIEYAHNTQHEKIIRGLALGLALLCYEREDKADALIEQLSSDKDALLRCGGMHALGLAYCGTANNAAVRQLLHAAVSDVSDDVRRAAVSALGFVLCKSPNECPRLVRLLSKGFNPHVRYGAAIAVGIACAGTGQEEALALLEPLTTDPVSFVRQGAYIASAMVLLQISESQNPKAATFRKQIEKVAGDRHEDLLTKMGAILAQGIIDAGGRNATIALTGPSGNNRLEAVCGMLVFCQHWFWHPLVHFLSLSFAPTALVGLNADLQMPKLNFRSNAKPSLFAYPPPLTAPTKQEVVRVPTAVLSTSVKAAKRAASKKDKEGGMEVDSQSQAAPTQTQTQTLPAEEPAQLPPAAATGEASEKKVEKKREPSFEELPNCSRVTPIQRAHISFLEESRYVPIKRRVAGIVVLRDTRPGEPVETIEAQPAAPAAAAAAAPEEPEPQVPESFEWP